MRETRKVRRGSCRNDYTFGDFFFVTAELIFCDYRHFRKPLKHMVSTPISPLPPDNYPKPAKDVVLPPTSLLLIIATTPAPYAVPSKWRPCDWSKAPVPTPLALNGLAEVVSSSAYSRWGETSWWVVRRRANGAGNTPPLLDTPAVA